jgi:hypothetical protein
MSRSVFHRFGRPSPSSSAKWTLPRWVFSNSRVCHRVSGLCMARSKSFESLELQITAFAEVATSLVAKGHQMLRDELIVRFSNSARRRPQPINSDSIAPLRLLRSVSEPAAFSSRFPCSAVSQLRTHTSKRRTPFTRRMPAASYGNVK